MKIGVSRNLYVILASDIVLISLSLYFAHLIRFDFLIPDWAFVKFLNMLPFVVVIKVLCFFLFDLYKGMWRYTSLMDLVNIVKASTIATVTIIVLILFLTRFVNVSRSVFVIDWCFTILFVLGLRLSTRVYYEKYTGVGHVNFFRELIRVVFKKKSLSEKEVIIIGAGSCGEKIVREIKENQGIRYRVLGFLDDDFKKIGRKIHGISVINSIDALEHTILSTGASEVIIAMPSAPAQRLRTIVEYCKRCKIQYKIVPNMGELINGKVTVNSIREVEYRDLLGREPVVLDNEKIGGYIGGKTILVSGAGGSIGSELCKQICRFTPECLILLERAESSLYEIDLQLKRDFPYISTLPMLADIQDKEELIEIFQKYKPNIVFHAAAYKHVPMLEAHPWKAVDNNIVGTENIVEVTEQFKCEKFVLVSTDKAVNPTNIMGASKRIAELIVQNRNTTSQSMTKFITVRFGNVIGSVGSVIPLFKKQIKEGGPVTVTHPDMIRYFMLIPEACQLILQSGAMGRGGEIFILEMGEPVKINEMAKDLIRFSGFEPDVDIKIEFTGLRPGEKLYEELMTDDENVIPTSHKKIMVLDGRKCDLSLVNDGINALKKISPKRDKQLLIQYVKKIVPEFDNSTSTTK